MSACSILLAALVLAPTSSAGVLVVSASGGTGVDAVSIQSAVDLAADGDTILVRDGDYSSFLIFAKSVSVIADGSNARILHGISWFGAEPTVRVHDLAPGQHVVVRGLIGDYGVEVSNCAGSVWFDQFEVDASISIGSCPQTSVPGASVIASDQVTFTACTLIGETGGNASWAYASPSPGAIVEDADAVFQDCTIVAGCAKGLSGAGPEPGGPGLSLLNADVTLVGCTIEGGAGALVSGIGVFCNATHPPGGPGIEFVAGGSNTSTVSSVATTAVGGQADLGMFCPGLTAPQGPAIAGSGTILPLAGFARFLRVESPARGGQTARFEAFGQPGELPLVLVSETSSMTPLPAYSGTLVISMPPTDTLALPAVPGTGPSILDVPIPPIGPLIGGLTYYTQAVFLDGANRLWLGGGSTLTIVDPAF